MWEFWNIYIILKIHVAIRRLVGIEEHDVINGQVAHLAMGNDLPLTKKWHFSMKLPP